MRSLLNDAQLILVGERFDDTLVFNSLTQEVYRACSTDIRNNKKANIVNKEEFYNNGMNSSSESIKLYEILSRERRYSDYNYTDLYLIIAHIEGGMYIVINKNMQPGVAYVTLDQLRSIVANSQNTYYIKGGKAKTNDSVSTIEKNTYKIKNKSNVAAKASLMGLNSVNDYLAMILVREIGMENNVLIAEEYLLEKMLFDYDRTSKIITSMLNLMGLGTFSYSIIADESDSYSDMRKEKLEKVATWFKGRYGVQTVEVKLAEKDKNVGIPQKKIIRALAGIVTVDEYTVPYGVQHMSLDSTSVRKLKICGTVDRITNNSLRIGNLEEVIIENGVREIINSLNDINSIVTLSLPASVRHIAGSFKRLSNLKTVIINTNGGVNLKYEAFSQCEQLKEIKANRAEVYISDGALMYCHGLEKISAKKINVHHFYYDEMEECCPPVLMKMKKQVLKRTNIR